MGAILVEERVVIDRNRITAGGVTAGIDFGFRVAAELRGKDVAERIQLLLEYDPQPPFDTAEWTAPPEMLAEVRSSAGAKLDESRQACARAMSRLRVSEAGVSNGCASSRSNTSTSNVRAPPKRSLATSSSRGATASPMSFCPLAPSFVAAPKRSDARRSGFEASDRLSRGVRHVLHPCYAGAANVASVSLVSQAGGR